MRVAPYGFRGRNRAPRNGLTDHGAKWSTSATRGQISQLIDGTGAGREARSSPAPPTPFDDSGWPHGDGRRLSSGTKSAESGGRERPSVDQTTLRKRDRMSGCGMIILAARTSGIGRPFHRPLAIELANLQPECDG
jgi:hypothetical protein